MGSKPKQADYQPGEDQKALASVAMAEFNNFKKNYGPLLQQMRDTNLENTVGSAARGRANADTMQALTAPENLSYQQLGDTDIEAGIGSALQGQLGEADRNVKAAGNEQQLGVLSSARGQAATAQAGLAQAARAETSNLLSEASRKQSERQTNLNAAIKLGTTLASSAGRNYGSHGSDSQLGLATRLFSPNAATREGESKRPGSLKERLSIGLGRL